MQKYSGTLTEIIFAYVGYYLCQWHEPIGWVLTILGGVVFQTNLVWIVLTDPTDKMAIIALIVYLCSMFFTALGIGMLMSYEWRHRGAARWADYKKKIFLYTLKKRDLPLYINSEHKDLREYVLQKLKNGGTNARHYQKCTDAA